MPWSPTERASACSTTVPLVGFAEQLGDGVKPGGETGSSTLRRAGGERPRRARRGGPRRPSRIRRRCRSKRPDSISLASASCSSVGRARGR